MFVIKVQNKVGWEIWEGQKELLKLKKGEEEIHTQKKKKKKVQQDRLLEVF